MEKSVLKQPSLATVSILGQPPGQADAIKYHFKAGSLFSSTAIFSLFFLSNFRNPKNPEPVLHIFFFFSEI